MNVGVKLDCKNRLASEVRFLLEQPIVKNQIVFYGDSAFTHWRKTFPYRPSEILGGLDLEEEVLDEDGKRCCLNRGFGAATAEELLYFYPQIIRQLEPRALVLNTFANDFFFAYSPSEIMSLLERIIVWARLDFPGINFYLCTQKILTWHDTIDVGCRRAYDIARREYRRLIEDYANNHDDCRVLVHEDFPPFFEREEDVGNYDLARRDIYFDDHTHFNREGYELYAKFFRYELFGVPF
ncbi:MAG: hypothetical protein GX900_04425 [Clostridiaceae bacterium]|nr:hypothetical protein [Clostridiaceae bacterium]